MASDGSGAQLAFSRECAAFVRRLRAQNILSIRAAKDRHDVAGTITPGLGWSAKPKFYAEKCDR